MNCVCYIKSTILLLAFLLSTFITTYSQNAAISSISNTGFAADSLGKVYYQKWQSSKVDSILVLANSQFVQSYNLKPKQFKFEYAITIARLFVRNKVPASYIKDWYRHAFLSYDFKPVLIDKPLTAVQKVVEKYYIAYEFINVYADTYGKCEDALEVLREHKTKFYFTYIKNKRKEKGYDKVWHDLEMKDHSIFTYCKEK